jgi:putative component of membrane protein insertase Oxa1/YidC/SpoIIIJ protein YidD
VLLAAVVLTVGIGYGLAAAGLGRPWTVAAIAVAVLLARKGVIAAVEVYQRYASDEIRRSCQMMPTCSEYCILAVRKYGAVVGLCKTMHRLLFDCKGPHFHEDWP